MSNYFKFSVLLIVFGVCEKIFALPDDIERCKIDDEKCLYKSSNRVLRRHYGGINEINLASLDPFAIKFIKVIQDAGIVTVRAEGKNINIYGFSKAKIEKISGFEKNQPEIRIRASKLSFNGTYSATGNVIGINIVGNGPFQVNFNNFIANLRMNLTRYENNGKSYFKIASTKFTFDISGGDMDIKDQGYIINTFLNASFDIIIKSSLITVISEEWGKQFEKELNSVFTKFAIEDMFLN